MFRTKSSLAITAICLTLAIGPPAEAQTWTGNFDASWNHGLNWNGLSVPNSATAASVFGNASAYAINIDTSVQTQSIAFGNNVGNYTITSSPGQTLSGLAQITVGSGVTTTETINLANVSNGSLLFAASGNLTITNNAAATAAPTLVIGSNTIIGSSGLGNGVVVSGTGTTLISGSFAADQNQVYGGVTMNGPGVLELTATNSTLFGATNNNYSVALNGGTVAINSDAALGSFAGYLLLNANSTTAGGLLFLNSGVTIARPVNVSSPTRVICNGTDVNTISGIVVGTGLLVKDGTGTLILTSADSTFSGGTMISAGTLQFGTAGVGLGAIVDNATLAYVSPTSFTLSNAISGSGGLSINGAALTLSGINTYSGPTAVVSGTLIAGSSAAFGMNSALSLPAGTALSVNGKNVAIGSLTGAGAVSNDANYAATLTLGGDNSSQTFSGPIGDGTGYPLAVVKIGAGTQTLTGRVTNTGGYLANAGTLEFSGALVQPGPSSLAAAAGATILYDGGTTVAGGYLRGPGTHLVTGGSIFSGLTAYNGAVINVTGPAGFVDFTNGGALTVTAGAAAPTGFNGFSNEGSGSITIAAASKINAADFQTYGLITLANAAGNTNTLLTNTGATPLYFNGGSRTFIGAVGGNGQAQLELNGQNAIVVGGLFVNNGHVTDSSALGVSTIIADYGALVKGAGTYDNSPVTQNGGRFQSGNSPGVATMGRFVFGPGGVSNYVFAIDDATGTAGPTPDALGHVSGWGLVKSAQWQRAAGVTSGDSVWTASAANPLTVAIDTLINPTTVGNDVPGLMADFDPTRAYSWPAVEWVGNYSGPTDASSLNQATNFDTSGVVNPVAGTFGWSLDQRSQTLSLTYTPSAVPEPGTLVLTAMGLAGVWRWRWKSHCCIRGSS